MKSVLITGGSSGIGEAAVKKFAQQGYQVFNLDINKPSQHHENSYCFHCDLSRPSEIQTTVNDILKKTDRLDVIVSSAGQYFSGSIEDTSEEDFDRIINLNLKGTFFLLKYVLPILKKQKKGSIILLGSDQSFIGKSTSAIYGASKGAIAQLTKSTALDYAQYNIRVNAVCPGTIDTPMFQNAIQKFHEKSAMALSDIEEIEAKLQPLNRIGKSEEVAELIYFLASDASSFITGSLYPIDGGYIAR